MKKRSISVSVILPTYNRRELTQKAIESVLEQSFSRWELLVVDDSSGDKSFEILSKKYGAENVKFLQTHQNLGVSAARNLAAEKARYEWLAFLDSDDIWHAEKLQKQAFYLERDPHCQVLHCDEFWVRHGGRVNPKLKHKKKGGNIFEQSLLMCSMSPSSVIMKKELFINLGMFREDYPVCEDYDLWLKIAAKMNVGYLNEPLLTKYGGHKDQLSKKYFAMDYWRVKSIDWVLSHSNLSFERQQKAKTVLLKKIEILLKGYLKHKNLKNLEEVQALKRKYS